MLFETPFIISRHVNLDGVFSPVSLAVDLGMVTFRMLERLVVGLQYESRLIPQLNCQEFFPWLPQGNDPWHAWHTMTETLKLTEVDGRGRKRRYLRNNEKIRSKKWKWIPWRYVRLTCNYLDLCRKYTRRTQDRQKWTLLLFSKYYSFHAVRMREATRKVIYNFRLFDKTVNIYSGTRYTSSLILCLLGIEAQRPSMKFTLLLPQKLVSLHQRIFYPIEPSKTNQLRD